MEDDGAHDVFCLIVTDGNAAGETIPVGNGVMFGRTFDGALSLGDDEKLSRRHAKVGISRNGLLFVEDLGSANGTWVNGDRITKPLPLVHGDVIKMGSTLLEVRRGTYASPPAAVPAEVGGTADTLATRVMVEASPLPVEQVGSPSSIHQLAPPPGAPPPSATLVHAGAKLPIAADGLTIGRLPGNDLVIDSDRASRQHARIEARDGRHFLIDLGSMNGTYLNGEHLIGEARWLNTGDGIAVGGELLRYLSGSETRAGKPAPSLDRVDSFGLSGSCLTIGRDPANDLVLEAPNISRFHAEIVTVDGLVELRDLGSRNGTRLDGEVIQRAPLKPGSEVGVGPFRLVFDGATFLQRDDRGALRLDCYGASVGVQGKTILNEVSLSIQPGEFIAVIGESGAGKTTLMRVLAGVNTPTDGAVCVNGEPVGARLTDIGYLPQDEIVHPRLTVAESLRYAARLRLPHDSTAEAIETAVAEVVREVELIGHENTRIDALSGGQRKRVGLATELLNRPALLFLDEPTTGLDPGLETKMMSLFRKLAAVGKHAVFVTTHATRNLDSVDKICVMGRGGELCFLGSPAEAKAFFAVERFDDIYERLEGRAKEWRQRFEADNGAADKEPPVTRPAPRRKPFRAEIAQRHAKVLVERYLRVFLRDRRNVLILLAQVPLLAAAMALLFKPNVFASPGLGAPSGAGQLLFLLVTSTVWLGTLDSAREIIKERAVLSREYAIGVDLRAYLASKIVVLFGLVTIQAAGLFVFVLLLRDLHAGGGAHLGLIVLLVLTGWTAVSMGLLISSAVSSDDQATALIPIAMIVQLLFGGAIVTIKNMGAIGVGAALIFARWAYAGAGSLIDMNARIAGDAHFRESNPYSHSFFALPWIGAYAILLAFLAVFLSLAWVALGRRIR